jgi:hypothetical protein
MVPTALSVIVGGATLLVRAQAAETLDAVLARAQALARTTQARLSLVQRARSEPPLPVRRAPPPPR